MTLQEAMNILNIQKVPSIKELQKIYKKKMMLLHPDVNDSESAIEDTQKLVSANDFLKVYLSSGTTEKIKEDTSAYDYFYKSILKYEDLSKNTYKRGIINNFISLIIGDFSLDKTQNLDYLKNKLRMNSENLIRESLNQIFKLLEMDMTEENYQNHIKYYSSLIEKDISLFLAELDKNLINTVEIINQINEELRTIEDKNEEFIKSLGTTIYSKQVVVLKEYAIDKLKNGDIREVSVIHNLNEELKESVKLKLFNNLDFLTNLSESVKEVINDKNNKDILLNELINSFVLNKVTLKDVSYYSSLLDFSGKEVLDFVEKYSCENISLNQSDESIKELIESVSDLNSLFLKENNELTRDNQIEYEFRLITLLENFREKIIVMSNKTSYYRVNEEVIRSYISDCLGEIDVKKGIKEALCKVESDVNNIKCHIEKEAENYFNFIFNNTIDNNVKIQNTEYQKVLEVCFSKTIKVFVKNLLLNTSSYQLNEEDILLKGILFNNKVTYLSLLTVINYLELSNEKSTNKEENINEFISIIDNNPLIGSDIGYLIKHIDELENVNGKGVRK